MSKRQKLLKNQSQRKKSALEEQSRLKTSDDKYARNFRVSFEYLDVNQGQRFEEWNETGLLLKMNNTLAHYCKERLIDMQSKKFKEYGEFPRKSDFKHPEHVEPDVNWGSLHVTGRAVLGGFIYENTFFVVFLDKDHRFYISEKKHT